ncbi:MAG: hypothetical protein Q9163_001683 [Psora crenata]
MRGQFLKTAASKDVCIFCVTRLQCSSTSIPRPSKRRTFASSGVVKRPPAAATAQAFDDEEDQTAQPSLQARGPQSNLQRWGNYSTNRPAHGQMMPADSSSTSLRQVVRPDSSARDHRPSGRAVLNTSSKGFREGDPNMPKIRRMVRNTSEEPPKGSNTYPKENTASEDEIYALQSKFNQQNGAFRPDWTSGQHPPATPTPQHLSREDQQMFAQARAAELERSRRREQTRDGRFVGFTQQRQTSESVDTLVPPSLRRRARPNAHEIPLQQPRTDIETVAGASVVEVDPALSFDPSFPGEDSERSESKPRLKGYGPPRKSQNTAWERAGIITAPYTRGTDARQKARRGGVLRSSEERDEEDEDRIARKQERKEQRKRAKDAQKRAAPPTPIYLPEFISVSNLAGVLRIRVEDFLKKMTELGFDDLNNGHILDGETAGLIAAEFNFAPVADRQEEQDLKPRPPVEDKSLLPARPPVVTIMGHVDHGKTTLLDYLRKSSVASSEHGGITQHIGAFSVSMPGGRLVTFLDTPGHAAFLAMRQRGANVTDIVILVVAADDSVKPQTTEAIKHAQEAKVPIIVAINKVDKEDSNVERVKQDLARYGVEIEDFGGDTQVVCVSGKTGQGMGELEDAVVALADILDMRAERDGQAEGWVLEATTKRAGRVATVLIRRGTLYPGDVVVAGTSWARVRTLHNEVGVMVPFAEPGIPVEVDGWREQPVAGDKMLQAPDEQKAKSVIEHRLDVSQRTQMAADMAAVNEYRRLEQEKRTQLDKAAALAAAQAEDVAVNEHSEVENTGEPVQKTGSTPTAPSYQEVHLILKADVSGSLEAVTNAISALGNDLVHPRILRSGVGPITEFDIDHAAVAKGHIISFNTVVDMGLRREAEVKGVRVIDQNIIYRLVDDVKSLLSEKMPDVVTQRVLGEAEVAQVFHINVKGRVTVPVAGCRVRNGVVVKGAKIRVLRDKEVVYDGTLSSLKNVKKDVTEMRKGAECGIGLEDWTDFKVGDLMQTYEESVEKRSL